jgi:hypothetical protein
MAANSARVAVAQDATGHQDRQLNTTEQRRIRPLALQ